MSASATASPKREDSKEIPVIDHPINYRDVDSGFEAPAPALGEHDRSVFRSLGYSEEQIDALEEAGAFGDPDER